LVSAEINDFVFFRCTHFTGAIKHLLNSGALLTKMISLLWTLCPTWYRQKAFLGAAYHAMMIS